MVAATIRHSKRESAPVVSTPIDLEQGRPGLYLCVPVRVKSRLRGYVVGLFDASALLGSLASTRVPADYQVRIFVADRLIHSNSPGQGVLWEQAKQMEARILAQNWRFVVCSRSDYLGAFKGSIVLLATVFSTLLYACVMIIVISHRRSLQAERMNAALQQESRRRAETEATVRELNRDLARRVADFQALLNVTPVGIAVAEDSECRKIWTNPALARMMRVPQTLNISKSGPNPGALPYRILQDGKEAPVEELPMQRAARTGLDVLGDEHEIVRGDGVAISVLSFASPLFDENGCVRGVVNACVDISERKAREHERAELLAREAEARERAEIALAAFQESEARFYCLIESDVIGVVIGTQDGIVEANGFFLDLLGYAHEDVKSGAVTWAAISPGFGPGVSEFVTELLDSGKVPARECELVHKGSRHVPVLLGGTILRPAPAWQAIFFVLDLTNRRELETRLRRAQTMKSLGVMAAGIAHDFNGLLTTIIGNAELAREQMAGTGAARQIESALEASQRAAEITRQILAYTGRSFHVLRPIDLGNVVLAARDSILKAAGKDIEVHCRVEPPLARVKADEEEVRQVLDHLIRNAVEALGNQAGRIEISTFTRVYAPQDMKDAYPSVEIPGGAYTVIELSDTGCGMSEEVLSRVFEPFFSTKFVGRGLGLAAVLGIMSAHRGAVRLRSSLNRGTQVQLLFPTSGGVSARTGGKAQSDPAGSPDFAVAHH